MNEWSPERYETLITELDDGMALEIDQAVEGMIEAAEESAVRFLLDGLGVKSIGEAYDLVRLGRLFAYLSTEGIEV